MHSYLTNYNCIELNNKQKRNIQLWKQYYKDAYHIAEFKANILARKKINIPFISKQ